MIDNGEEGVIVVAGDARSTHQRVSVSTSHRPSHRCGAIYSLLSEEPFICVFRDILIRIVHYRTWYKNIRINDSKIPILAR